MVNQTSKLNPGLNSSLSAWSHFPKSSLIPSFCTNWTLSLHSFISCPNNPHPKQKLPSFSYLNGIHRSGRRSLSISTFTLTCFLRTPTLGPMKSVSRARPAVLPVLRRFPLLLLSRGRPKTWIQNLVVVKLTLADQSFENQMFSFDDPWPPIPSSSNISFVLKRKHKNTFIYYRNFHSVDPIPWA